MGRGISMKTPENLARAQQLRAEGKLFREIAEEIGVAVQTIDAWLNDPDGSRIRARKDSYRGTCIDCSGPTSGCNGRGPRGVPTRCARCHIDAIHDDERREAITLLYREGVPSGEIARRLGIAKGTVTKTAAALRREGVDVPLQRMGGTAAERATRHRRVMELLDDGVGIEQIASECGYKHAPALLGALRHHLALDGREWREFPQVAKGGA